MQFARLTRILVILGLLCRSDGLLSGAARPAWGRDIGPDLKYDREAPPQTLGHSDHTPSDASAFNHSFLPSSPKGQPDLSFSDPTEAVQHALGTVVGKVMDATLGNKALGFTMGSSCEEVCEGCVLSSVGLCQCFADCDLGGNGQICDRVHKGWSGSTEVTAPKQSWRSSCTGGDRSCVETCLSDSFQTSVRQCQQAENPQPCFDALRRAYPAPAAVPSEDVSYCMRAELPSCDKFLILPTNSSGEWFCFHTLKPCELALRQLGGAVPVVHNPHESPSAWRSAAVRL